MRSIEEKKDIRIRKTEEAIYDALLSLMNRMSFHNISVKLLCQEARISRSTFYDHFEDKYHLLHCLLQDISQEVAKDFVYFTDTSLAGAVLPILREKYRNLLKKILLDSEDRTLYDIYYKVISSDIREKVCIRHPEVAQETAWVDFVSGFYTAGILSVVSLWISGKVSASENDVNRYMHLLLGPLHETSGKICP